MATSQISAMPEHDARHMSVFRSDWENLASASDRFQNLRTDAIAEFERIGFPIHRKGNELWKYTDLRAVDRAEFAFGTISDRIDASRLASLAPRSEEWLNIVFIDGVFSPELSDDIDSVSGLSIHTLKSVDDGKTNGIGRLAEYRDNAFVALNTAFISDGLSISVDADTDVESAISVVFATTQHPENQRRAVYPRILLSANRNSSATLIETHVSASDASHMSAPVVEIRLDEASSLSHYRLQLDNEQSFHFATTRVSQSTASSYSSTSFAIGAAIGRNDVHTLLNGENTECQLNGVYITTNDQHQDNEISTTHAAPRGTSHQYYKGILSGKSQAVFSGKIVVERGAQKTDADQKDLNLMLSHGAEVDTKPSLEIYADDVKCAHGATAGHVDENTLFYLQSRGIDYQTAQAMLIRGFAAEILDEFEPPALREFLDNALDELMPDLQASSDTIGTA